MTLRSSFWGVQGFVVTNASNCFNVGPDFGAGTTKHHIILANNVCNGSSGNGINSNSGCFGDPAIYPNCTGTTGTPHTGFGVDYYAVIGNWVYGTATSNSDCYAGISLYEPVNSDTVAGTHIYIAGNLVNDTINGATCSPGGGHTNSYGGDGILFDTFDGYGNAAIPLPSPYTGQSVVENNFLLANGGSGFDQYDNQHPTPSAAATQIIRGNTAWANQTDPHYFGYPSCGQIRMRLDAEGSANTTITKNLMDSTVANSACSGASGSTLYDMFVASTQGGPASTVITGNFSHAASGLYFTSTEAAANNASGVVSVFGSGGFGAIGWAGAADPGAPPSNCSGYATVPACFTGANVVANFTSSNAPAYGYQVPGSNSPDSNFPQWLCGVTNMPAGLIQMGCLSANTFYVDLTSGSDTNNGTSKTTPWLHAPGMSGCASSCAANTPAAGNSYILKGGTSATLSAAWNWSWSGSSGNPIYIGVDTGWYTGGSFTRPVLTGGGTWPGAAVSSGGCFFCIGNAVSYGTLDNIAFTGLYWSGSANLFSYVGIGGSSNGWLFSNNYMHGWSHASSGAENNNLEAFACGGSGTGTNTLYRNVVDGSDTALDSFMGVEGACLGEIYQSYFGGLMYGINGTGKFVHDNSFVGVGYVSYDGVSHNGVVISNLDNLGPFLFYNNYVDAVGAGANVPIWQTPVLNTISYAFNNIMPNQAPVNGAGLQCGEFFFAPPPIYSGGRCLWFNNTIEAGPDSGPNTYAYRIGTGQPGTPPAGVFQYNNHIIGNSTIQSISPECASACPVTTSNQVQQTKSAANAQGYSYAQTFPFSPTLGTNATVGAGINENLLCTTIGSIFAAAGTACLSDTTSGVTYNATTHTVTGPGRIALLRPTVGAWDVGAYQFSGSSGGGSIGNLQPGTKISAGVKIQ
jgi:hypothetical protein